MGASAEDRLSDLPSARAPGRRVLAPADGRLTGDRRIDRRQTPAFLAPVHAVRAARTVAGRSGGRVDSEETAGRYVHLQTARWRSMVSEIEDLFAKCVRSDEVITDLARRVQSGAPGNVDSEVANHRALVRTLAARPVSSASTFGGTLESRDAHPKTRRERKMELLDLRHELAKTLAEDAEADPADPAAGPPPPRPSA